MSSKVTGGGYGSDNLTQKLFPSGSGNIVNFEKDGMRRCMGCMELYSEDFDICPHCGYVVNQEVANALHMYPGTVLHDKYIIGKVVGYGGFGVTYLAWDTVLAIKVAIKEYLPSEFSTRSAGQTQITVFSGDKSKQFNDGLNKFVDEAKRLAKFRNENGIVKIFDSFNENGTAYIAMEYLQGETLAERLEREKTIPVEEAISLLMPIIESLNHVHDEGIIHRDIAPDNIFLTTSGEVKLIDFGAARYATTSRSRSLTVIIKPGYSAEEQYRSRGDQGPHTDVYSVGACIYKMITGNAPPDAMERRAQFEKNHKDMLIPIKKFVKGLDPNRENAIYNALNVRIEDRTPDMISLAGELTSEEPVKRRRSGIKKIDPLTWPLWAKIGIPAALTVVITLCTLLAFGVIGPDSINSDYYVPEGQVLVPNVVGMEMDKAEKKLSKNNLLPIIADKRTSETIPSGCVLMQTPDGLSVANKGSEVELIKCDGHGFAFVPDVVGKELAVAKAEIEAEGFVVVTKESKSDIVAPGSIISQNPEAFTELEKTNEVELTVSTGASDIDTSKTVTVPNLVGKQQSEAEEALKALQLYITIEEIFDATKPVGQITGQLPVSGETVHCGDTIVVTVNRGEETVQVPDVTSMTVETASATIESLGLICNTNYQESSEYKAGTVISQDVKTGTAVRLGSTVTLTVSSGKKVTVPNVVNQTQSKAESTLISAGLAVNVTEQQSTTVSKGTVISQGVAAGTKVEHGTIVNIVVSTGTDAADIETSMALISLEITSTPRKTTYSYGERLDTSGMKVLANYANGSSKDVTSICRTNITTLNSYGNNTVTVTYSEGGVSRTASFYVTVEDVSLSISPNTLTITVGSSGTVTATLSGASGRTINWSSADSSVATVSNGTITGVGAGNTTVTASVSVGSKTANATCSVHVTSSEIQATGVSVSESSVSLWQNEGRQLRAYLEPSNATTKNITWTSSDSGIASVDSSGYVKAKKEGSATITAKIPNGKTASCKVTVKKLTVSGISVAVNPNKQIYVPGESFEPEGMKILVNYTNGTNSTIPARDCTLTVNGNKSCVITKSNNTVVVSCEGKTTNYQVTVKDVSVTVTGPATIAIGEAVKLSAVATPKGTAITEWKSSNTSVAAVDSTGLVTGKSAGTASITASSQYATSQPFTITVNGSLSVKEIKIDNKKTDYYVGDEINTSMISVTATMSNGDTKTIGSGEFNVSPAKFTSASRTTVTVSYGGKSKTFDITPKQPTLSLDTTNKELDAKTELSVKAEYKPATATVEWQVSGSISKVGVTDGAGSSLCKIKTQNSGSGTLTAKLINNGVECVTKVCNITIKQKEQTPTVTGIEISRSTAGSETYFVGDSVNASDFRIKVYYSNSTTEILESGFDIYPTTLTRSGSTDIKATYNGYTSTNSYNISVNEPKLSISVDSKNIDAYGNSSGTVAHVKKYPDTGWSDFKWSTSNEKAQVTNGNDESCQVNSTRNAASGSFTVTVSAKYNGNPQTATIDITIEAQASYWGFEYNGKSKYGVGEKFDRDSVTVKVYDSNKNPIENITNGFTLDCSGWNNGVFTEAGTYTIEVFYNKTGLEYKERGRAVFEITVVEPTEPTTDF